MLGSESAQIGNFLTFLPIFPHHQHHTKGTDGHEHIGGEIKTIASMPTIWFDTNAMVR